MTLQASPPITLTQVCAEYGAPATTALSAFLRGGAWVPNVAGNSSVPTALPISLTQLCGSAKYIAMSGANATSLSESTNNGITNYTTVGQSNASVSGGNPSKTYTWNYVSGASFTINAPNSSATSFTQAGKPPVGTYSGLYSCTINDGTGSITTNNATITINRT